MTFEKVGRVTDLKPDYSGTRVTHHQRLRTDGRGNAFSGPMISLGFLEMGPLIKFPASTRIKPETIRSPLKHTTLWTVAFRITVHRKSRLSK